MFLLTAVMLFCVGLVVLALSAVALVMAFLTKNIHWKVDWLLFGFGIVTLLIGSLIVWYTYQYV